MEFSPFDVDGGLRYATRLPGSDDRLDWNELRPPAEPPPLWVNLDRTKARAQQWLRQEAGLDPIVAESLLATETRPGVQPFDDGLLVILRGVNLNPGVEVDEMITVRMWIAPTCVITLRQFRFQTLVELRERSRRGEGPATAGSFLAAVASGLSQRLAPTVTNLEELLDEIEESMLDQDVDGAGVRATLATIRRQAIMYRRYLVPQREAMLSLVSMQHQLLTQRDQAMLRVATEQVARAAEALEEVRDRAAVTTEEIRARQEARMAKTLYLLTIVATIALPLGLITGLFGINVGGMPWMNDELGFVIVCVVMLVIAGAEFAIFKAMKWI